MVAPSPGRGQLCHAVAVGSAGWTLQCKEVLRAASVPRAGIRPRTEREERTHIGSSEHRGKQREPGGRLAASSPSLWPAQRKLLPHPCLLLPSVWHSTPARAAGSLRKTPTPTRNGKGRKPCALKSGLPRNVGSTPASRVDGRPWQCCARGSRLRHCIPRTPLPLAQGAARRRPASPAR